MTKTDRGQKHLCPECECKYYDLGKKAAVCPRCGAKPPAAKLQSSGRPVRSSRSAAAKFRS